MVPREVYSGNQGLLNLQSTYHSRVDKISCSHNRLLLSTKNASLEVLLLNILAWYTLYISRAHLVSQTQCTGNTILPELVLSYRIQYEVTGTIQKLISA